MTHGRLQLDIADGTLIASLGVGLLQGRWIFVCALIGLSWLRAREKRRALEPT